MKTVLAALAALLPLGAAAQVVTECDWIGNPANIVEPWETSSRSYANGAIRVAWLDTGGEPVCCSSHLLILSPSGDGAQEPAYRQCRVVSARPGGGFYGFDVARTVASYDPAQGLLLSVPVFHWHEGIERGAAPIEERIEVRVNQATGSVTIE